MIECLAMVTNNSCILCHSFKEAGLDLISSEKQLQVNLKKQTRHFRKNDIIFSQGEVVNEIHCVSSGLIKLESVGEDGHSITIGLLKCGDMLGLGNILSQTATTYSATAIEDTYACTLPADFFRYILSDTPALALQYLTKAFNCLRETRQRLLSGVDKDVPSRVAEALVYLKANYPDHTFTRREIAEWAGTTTESVIRTLSQFEDDGIIAQHGRKITITDSSRLSISAGALI